MKKGIFWIVCLAAFSGLAILSFNLNRELKQLTSPMIAKEAVLGINQWFPESKENTLNVLSISAKAALFADAKSGEALFVKNIHDKLPVASLVKVMTALVALEQKGMDAQFTVSQRAAEMEPDKMFLKAGEKLTLKELLSGVFLISANDAAEVIAEGTTGERREFIELMNRKAKQLSMKNTLFINPTGLDKDTGSSYSTAYDLTVLTRYLIKHYPEVVNISQSEHIYLPATENHQDYDMYSGINLLTTYPGVIGFKTGYTPEAGLTLITLARKNNQEIIGVLLGSADRRDEARGILDYSFSKPR